MSSATALQTFTAGLSRQAADDEASCATSYAYLVEVDDAVPQAHVFIEQLYAALRAHGIHARVSPLGREAGVPANAAEVGGATTDSHRGEALIAAMARDGSLIDGETLAAAWGITRQALDKARTRGEIFSVRMGRLHYYPAAALHFLRPDFERINRAFPPDVAAGARLLFFTRKHGSLGGKTVAEAADRTADIVALAGDWERI